MISPSYNYSCRNEEKAYVVIFVFSFFLILWVYFDYKKQQRNRNFGGSFAKNLDERLNKLEKNFKEIRKVFGER